MSGDSPRTVVTFGDGAFDVLTDVLPTLLAAVLPPGVTLQDSSGAHDMQLTSADTEGVTGRRTDADDEPVGEPVTVSWTDIGHIHIY